MSFVDVQTARRGPNNLFEDSQEVPSTGKNQGVRKVGSAVKTSKEKHSGNAFVTYKFRKMVDIEQPSLASSFPVTLMPCTTEYFIVSDKESGDSDDSAADGTGKGKGEGNKSNKGNKGKGKDNASSEAKDVEDEDEDEDDENDDDVSSSAHRSRSGSNESGPIDNIRQKEQSSLKDKLLMITKDIGQFFANPTSNIREFLRRREGYSRPPCQDASSHEH